MRIKEMLAAGLLILVITFNVIIVGLALGQTYDFGSFAASGINLKKQANPYDPNSPLVFESVFPSVNAGGRLPNLNPPFTLLFFGFITEQNVLMALNIWRGLSVVLYLVTLLILARRYQPGFVKLIWGLALAGIWHTIGLGQIYVPLLLITTLAWISLEEKREVMAGLLLGLLISVKPNFFLWLMILLASGNWRTPLAAVGIAAILGWIPVFPYGTEVYIQWLEAARVSPEILAMPGNSSIPGMLSRMGGIHLSIIVGMILLAPILLIIRLKSQEPNRIPASRVNELGISLSLLLSPISWVGYTILLLPAFLSRRDWSLLRVTAAILLATPFTVILNLYPLTRFNFIFWGAYYTWALALSVMDNLDLPTRREINRAQAAA